MDSAVHQGRLQQNTFTIMYLNGKILIHVAMATTPTKPLAIYSSRSTLLVYRYCNSGATKAELGKEDGVSSS